jgi:hypothetical protein
MENIRKFWDLSAEFHTDKSGPLMIAKEAAERHYGAF